MIADFDALSDAALEGYLTGAAVERGERFIVEERDGEWIAEFRFPNPLAGEPVPIGGVVAALDDEGVSLRVNGRHRRTAMVSLAYLLALEG